MLYETGRDRGPGGLHGAEAPELNEDLASGSKRAAEEGSLPPRYQADVPQMVLSVPRVELEE